MSVLEMPRWHGVDRAVLDWSPSLAPGTCTGCGLCFLTCGNDVFRWDAAAVRPVVANPKNCVVGCTTCARVCPEDALTFPSEPRVYVRGVITKHKILPTVKKDLEARLQKFPDHVVETTV